MQYRTAEYQTQNYSPNETNTATSHAKARRKYNKPEYTTKPGKRTESRTSGVTRPGFTTTAKTSINKLEAAS
jgi:hypothetical protein